MVQLRQSAAPPKGVDKNEKDLTIMKKLLIALLLVLSCVLLFACVQDDPATDTTAPSDGVTDAPTDTPTEAPTDTPTEAPTDEATDEPTEEATEEVTEPETEPVVLYQLLGMTAFIVLLRQIQSAFFRIFSLFCIASPVGFWYIMCV